MELAGLPQRFTAKLRVEGECWIWTAGLTNNGYARFKYGGKTVMGHRFAFESVNGPIPEGLALDHLCRRRPCVNPSHLEAVTPRTNVLRGDTITGRNAVKTHCYRGHPLLGANLFVRRDGRRRCRTCEKASQLKTRARPEYKRQAAQRERTRRQQMKERTA
jgi:hypothetical protein